MYFEYTPHFQRQLKKLPPEVQQKFRKQAAYLLYNIRHPSLRAKKYNENEDVWQARVDDYYRFYFEIKRDCYAIASIERHRD